MPLQTIHRFATAPFSIYDQPGESSMFVVKMMPVLCFVLHSGKMDSSATLEKKNETSFHQTESACAETANAPLMKAKLPPPALFRPVGAAPVESVVQKLGPNSPVLPRRNASLLNVRVYPLKKVVIDIMFIFRHRLIYLFFYFTFSLNFCLDFHFAQVSNIKTF